MVTEAFTPSSGVRGQHNLGRTSTSIQIYARVTGALLLLSVLAGFFGELYVPSKLLASNDAAATAGNFIEHDALFRLGFANYLVEAVCDVTLSLLFVVLLKPVHMHLAWLSAFFGLVSTATFAAAKLFYFTASFIVGSADLLVAFSPDQVNAIAMLTLEVYGYGGELFMVFYGVASILRGYLIVRSGYLPKLLGVLLATGGVGFVTKNFTLVLAPAYSSSYFLVPMLVAMLSLALWLIVRGVHGVHGVHHAVAVPVEARATAPSIP